MSEGQELTGQGWEVGLTTRSQRGKYRFRIFKDGVCKAETPARVAFPEEEDAIAEANGILGARFEEGRAAGRAQEASAQADEVGQKNKELAQLKADKAARTDERDELDRRCRGLTETLDQRNTLLNRAKDSIEEYQRELRHARRHRWLALAAGLVLGAAAYAAVLRFGADYLPLF